MVTNGLRFGPLTEVKAEKPKPAPRMPKRPREKQPKQKNDPKYIAAARELRDRYLEQLNTERLLPAAHGKYDVSRQLEAAPIPGVPGAELKQMPPPPPVGRLLKAAWPG